jgi:hypothetical protein
VFKKREGSYRFHIPGHGSVIFKRQRFSINFIYIL